MGEPIPTDTLIVRGRHATLMRERRVHLKEMQQRLNLVHRGVGQALRWIIESQDVSLGELHRARDELEIALMEAETIAGLTNAAQAIWEAAWGKDKESDDGE